MKSTAQSNDGKKSSTFLITSTLIGVLTILLFAGFYYISTNTYIVP